MTKQRTYRAIAPVNHKQVEKAAVRKVDEWKWGDYITLHDGSLRVSLAAAGVRDADLESLCSYLLQSWEDRYAERFPRGCDLTMDLSCNSGLSDYGIIVHLVPLLRSWPTCRRLKLYQTSIGDRALEALSPWIAEGYAHELHLSDLNGEVSPAAILALLRTIHYGGQYPYWKHDGGRAPLWLRLEHNRLENPDELVAQARAEGVSIRVLSRSELSEVRPGDDLRRRWQDSPEIILVLFRLQHRRGTIQDKCVEQARDLLSMLGKNVGAGAGSWAGAPISEPQPLSVDEFRLWEMEAREAAECGANDHNRETFGEDVEKGWSFEENLAANAYLEQLASSGEWWQHQQQWLQQQPGGFMDGDWADGLVPTSLSSRASGVEAMGEAGWVAGGSAGAGGVEAAEAVTAPSWAPVCKAGKSQVDDAINHALQLIPNLQRMDFDGQVKQYLHAIRNKGGQKRVLEAIEVIRAAMMGKTRNHVRKWPAYLVALLKRFLLQQMVGVVAEIGAAQASSSNSDVAPASAPTSAQAHLPDECGKSTGHRAEDGALVGTGGDASARELSEEIAHSFGGRMQ